MMQDDFGRAYMGDRLLRRLEHQQAREASWQRQVVVYDVILYVTIVYDIISYYMITSQNMS